MKTELDFYLSLFENFLKTKNNNEKKILWKLNSIIKVMEKANEKHNSLFCENGLRLIMLLFKNYQFDSCDIESKKFDNSLPQEKEIIIPILREEFI